MLRLGPSLAITGPIVACGQMASVGGAALIPLETPSSTIASGGVTWTLNKTVQWYKIDGWPCILDPGGLTILSRTDPATTVGGSEVNGTMKNPQRLTTSNVASSQGWDQRITDGSGNPGVSYNAALNQPFPIAVASGDVIIGAKYAPAGATVKGWTEEYSPLYIVDGQKQVGSVLPAPVRWTGWAGHTWRAFDAAAFIASWGSAARRSTAGMTLPDYAKILNAVSRFEPSWGRQYGATKGDYEDETTYGFTQNAPASNNYGQVIGGIIGAAGLYLISDAITDEQKVTLLRHLVRIGLHTWEPANGQGDAPKTGNGGHWQFDFIPKVLALHCLGLSSDLDALHTVHPGNLLTQGFLHTSATIADLVPHDLTTKPYAYRKRTISAVSGLTITVPSLSGDPSQTEFNGLRLVRVSDGASALTENSVNNGATYDIPITAQPGSPFAPGDEVYCATVDPIRIGDADWVIGNPVTGWASYTPSYLAPYRILAKWSDDVMVPRALGIWRSAWDAAEKYAIRANRQKDPATARDFDDCHDTVLGVHMAKQFWDTHAASIFSGAPQMLALPTISGTGEIGATLTAVINAMAGNAPITYGSYQWMADGVDISGATSSTYVPVSGDLGKVITFRVTATNGAGSTVCYSAEGPTVITAFAANGVSFAGAPSAASLAYNSMTSVPAGKVCTMFVFLRVPISWPTGGDFFKFRDSSGNNKVGFNFASTGRITFQNSIANYTTPNNTFAPDTGPTGAYYAIGVSVDTRAGQRRAQLRVNNTVFTMSGIAAGADDALLWNAALGRYTMGVTAVDIDLSEPFADFSVALNLSDNAVWAKFASTASRGADGSIPTGASPVLYHSGDASVFATNRGTGGGGSVTNGPLTNSAYDPA